SLLHAVETNGVERDRRVPFGVIGHGRRREGRPGEIRSVRAGQRSATLPRPLRRGFATGMSELDAELHVRHPASNPLDDRPKRSLVLVAIKSEASLRDAPCLLDMRGFETQEPRT